MPSYDFSTQVDELLQRQMETGQYSSVDEVLIAALNSLTAEREDWVAIKEALDTLDDGNPGVSLEDAFAEVRRRNNITSAT